MFLLFMGITLFYNLFLNDPSFSFRKVFIFLSLLLASSQLQVMLLKNENSCFYLQLFFFILTSIAFLILTLKTRLFSYTFMLFISKTIFFYSSSSYWHIASYAIAYIERHYFDFLSCIQLFQFLHIEYQKISMISFYLMCHCLGACFKL